MDNKDIFAHNLKRIMALKDKNRRDIYETLGISYFTVSDWVNGKKMPRMDKVEILANYFGIQKSDLIEEPMTEEKEKDNDVLANIIVRMRSDKNFFNLVNSLYVLDDEKIEGVQTMLQAFGK